MQSYTGTSGSNVMASIVVSKYFVHNVKNFIKKISFSADLNFWFIYLSSAGKEFHIVGTAKESDRCPTVCSQFRDT